MKGAYSDYPIVQVVQKKLISYLTLQFTSRCVMECTVCSKRDLEVREYREVIDRNRDDDRWDKMAAKIGD